MNPNTVIVAAAVMALVVNTLVVVGVAWRGGHVLGRLERGQESSADVQRRTIEQLDALEIRVGRLEGRK